jgi:spore germination cell wall hydrolase CwlJ-like protein
MRPLIPAVALAGLVAMAAPAAAQDKPKSDTVNCVAEAVYFEARGTSDRSREAVAHVVLNRAEDPEFPDTPCEVVEEGCQFSYNCDGKPETLAVREDREEALETAEKVVEGVAPDPTDGAVFFHNESVSPDWASSAEPTAEIDGHTFYKNDGR